mmetsp:Transcript_175837/g.427683  ORF Transcript_175837/g.427683 Transcript_175837/m.427683 type:complete len:119 (+) Transcript_175837:276-632(+)
MKHSASKLYTHHGKPLFLVSLHRGSMEQCILPSDSGCQGRGRNIYERPCPRSDACLFALRSWLWGFPPSADAGSAPLGARKKSVLIRRRTRAAEAAARAPLLDEGSVRTRRTTGMPSS